MVTFAQFLIKCAKVEIIYMSKTREMLVDVARQLFAKSGLENTTMNDIAVASRKGRRTLYTYFKNKNEIYWAVVESELAHLLQRLKDIANKDLPPEEKLTNYILTRLEAVKETVLRNGTLKAEFFRDIWKVEQADDIYKAFAFSILNSRWATCAKVATVSRGE